MQKYRNLNGDSNVVCYLIAEDAMTIQFNDGVNYRYSNSSAGISNIMEMKRLAELGRGLNGFINRRVKKMYDSKWR